MVRFRDTLFALLFLTFEAGVTQAEGDVKKLEDTTQVRLGQCEIEVLVRNKAVTAELKETCEAAVEDIFSTFGGKPALSQFPVSVRIVSSPDQIADAAPKGVIPPPWSEAVAFPEHNMIVLSLRNHIGAPIADLPEVLRHELSHLALRQALKGKAVPRWFSEGIAIHQSEESAIERHLLVWRAALSNRMLPLSEIDQYPERTGDVNLAYAQAADFLAFLLNQDGRFGIRAVIRKVADGEQFDKAVDAVYGQSLLSMERDWRSTLIQRWRWVSLLASQHALWGAIVVLFIAAYIATRRRKKRKLLVMQREEEAVERVIETLESMAAKTLPSSPKASSLERIPTKIRIDDDIHTLH
jgi:hypothetical protein